MTSGASAGSGTANQGYNGATGGGSAGGEGGGGGGGAGAVGSVQNSRGKAVGVASSITGTSVTRGIGGASGTPVAANIAGQDNTGTGGDQCRTPNTNSFAGGSGIVIVRYFTGDAIGFTVTGGEKFVSGIYTVHYFTTVGTTSLVIL